MKRKETPYKNGYFACPNCREYIPDIKVKCICGLELNASEKIKNLVKTLNEQEKSTSKINKRLGEMNLLFSRVIKWNYGQRIAFRNKSFDKLNRLIHKWEKR